LYFSMLAQHLPRELPIYGLPGLSPGEPPLHTMHTLAGRMVNLLQRVQPDGPYRLAGWSFGGVLAYEIAQQLLDQGHTLEFLGLIDAFCPDGQDVENNHEGTPNAILVELCKEKRRWEDSPENSDTLDLDELDSSMSFDELFNHYRVLQMLPENFEHLSSDEARLQCHNIGIYSRAMAIYRPGAISIPVHLFVASDQSQGAPIATATLGWEHYVAAHLLHTHTIPGNHRSVMKLPQIKTLGQRLTETLAATVNSAYHPQSDRQELKVSRVLRPTSSSQDSPQTGGSL
jgi:arthrofactin-type cyclic lipopeptide synthetase C